MTAAATIFCHSFPRKKELRDSNNALRVLRSILESGLLLVPEELAFDKELRDDGEPERVFAIQRRFCLTMISQNEIPDHSDHFGPITISFEPAAARILGAIPVIYLPQPTRDGSQPTLDRLGYFFVYRLIELQKLCQRILLLQEAVRKNANRKLLRIALPETGSNTIVETSVLSNVLRMVNFRIEDLSHCIAAIRGLSSLFYPTDKFRGSSAFVDSSLYYYYQREWRIISDIVVDGVDIDVALTSRERSFLLDTSPEFFGSSFTLRRRQIPRVDACSMMRSINGKPIRSYVTSVTAPAEWKRQIELVLEEFDMRADLHTYER